MPFSVKIKTSFALPLYQELEVAEETYKPGQPSHCCLNHGLKQVLMWVLHIPSPWLLPLHLFVSQSPNPKPWAQHRSSTLLLSPGLREPSPPSLLYILIPDFPQDDQDHPLWPLRSSSLCGTTKPLFCQLFPQFSSFSDNGWFQRDRKWTVLGT